MQWKSESSSRCLLKSDKRKFGSESNNGNDDDIGVEQSPHVIVNSILSVRWARRIQFQCFQRYFFHVLVFNNGWMIQRRHIAPHSVRWWARGIFLYNSCMVESNFYIIQKKSLFFHIYSDSKTLSDDFYFLNRYIIVLSTTTKWFDGRGWMERRKQMTKWRNSLVESSRRSFWRNY